MSETIHVCLQELTASAIAPFGRILEPASNEAPEVSAPGAFDFYVLFSVQSGGWQIGYLRLSAVELTDLERHPGTPEVFVPLQGRCGLIVSTDGKDLRAFILSCPVVLDAGVWHGVVCVSGTPTVLIAENNNVTDEFFPCGRRIVCSRGEETR